MDKIVCWAALAIDAGSLDFRIFDAENQGLSHKARPAFLAGNAHILNKIFVIIR